jgi:hypothetical protein
LDRFPNRALLPKDKNRIPAARRSKKRRRAERQEQSGRSARLMPRCLTFFFSFCSGLTAPLRHEAERLEKNFRKQIKTGFGGLTKLGGGCILSLTETFK